MSSIGKIGVVLVLGIVVLVVAGLVGLPFATAVGTPIFLRIVNMHRLRDLDDLFAQSPRLFHVAVVFDTLMAKL